MPEDSRSTPARDRPIDVPGRASGALLYDGVRIPIGDSGLVIGRAEESDVTLAGERVSRQHARLAQKDGEFWLEDLGSRNGTLLNGERLAGGPRVLASGDTISVGDEVLRFIGGQETRMASRQLPIVGTQVVQFEGERLTIGRDPSNDVVLPDPNISRFHAEALARDGEVELVDLGSRNGTRVDGRLVERAQLSAGSQIGIGPFRLVFDGLSFVARDDHGGLRMDAENLSYEVKGKQILARTSVSIEPGEFVAIIGESGAGKSTLIKLLTGVNRPSSGRVLVNGDSVDTRLTDIGYVPQDEIVHGLLSVREALRYAARLRLPQDASEQELDETIERVLDELSLGEQATTRIDSISGGQRKRTGVATELLSRPSLLFLDEPTTGLDPGLEGRMMALLRTLADNSRAVTVVTHATKNLEVCDRVIVMARGGYLAFQGPPREALEFFEVDSFDDIYTALDSQPPDEWQRRFAGTMAGASPTDAGRETISAPVAQPSQRRKQRRVLPQAAVLTGRYLRLLLRDRRNLALLLGQVPVLALALVAVFESGLFERPDGNPSDGLQLLFLLVTTTIWLGAIDAAREIIKERSVFERESAVGTRLSAYMLSKAAVLFGLTAVQTVLLCGIVFAFQPLHEPLSTYAAVIGALILTSWVAVGMGLAVSALVSSEDQATSFIPLALIPQLLFAGSLVAVQSMREPIEILSAAVFSRWSFATVGSEVDLNGRIAEDPQFARLDKYGPDFFDLPYGTGMLVLAAFLALFFAVVTVMLRRQLRH